MNVDITPVQCSSDYSERGFYKSQSNTCIDLKMARQWKWENNSKM